MKSFVALLALVAVVAADVSHLRSSEADAQVVSQNVDVAADGFQYAYETSNGISGQESGVLKNAGGETASIVVSGSNSYTSPEGQPISLTFVADENGYHAEGAHLPTTPPPQPIPDYIIRSLEYIAAHPPKPEPGQRY